MILALNKKSVHLSSLQTCRKTTQQILKKIYSLPISKMEVNPKILVLALLGTVSYVDGLTLSTTQALFVHYVDGLTLSTTQALYIMWTA